MGATELDNHRERRATYTTALQTNTQCLMVACQLPQDLLALYAHVQTRC